MFYLSHPLLFDHIQKMGFWGLCEINDESENNAVLTEKERNEYKAIHSPKRKREWLSARIALKTMLLEGGWIDSPMHCQVEKDRFGCPRVRIGNGGNLTFIDCSISHKKGVAAVCISWIPHLKMGIDLELISEKPIQLRSAFARQDDALVGVSKVKEFYAILWACKEAASKAVGLGMRIDFRKLQVKGDQHRKFFISVDGKEAIQGYYFFFQDFIVALCHLIFFIK